MNLDLRDLKVISALGRGAKGVVFLVQAKNGEFLALKGISKALIEKNHTDSDNFKRISFEQEVLGTFHHPLLPKLHGVLSTDKIIGYVIDYCPGRDLNSLRKSQTEKTFSDDIIRFYGAELVLALEYLHSLGIVYRDLKPENVMIQENGHLMLVDFDLSTRLPLKTNDTVSVSAIQKSELRKKKLNSWYMCLNLNPLHSIHPDEKSNSMKSENENENKSVEKSNSFVGTEEYVAPEIILGNGHDFAVDWWCLGVVMYEMLYGATPFRGENRKETFYRVLSKSPGLIGERTPLRDLIGKLLEKDPGKRISVEGIKVHDFFGGVNWERIVDISRPPFIPVKPEVGRTEGNRKIDVELFVQEIFKVGTDDKDDDNKNNGDENFLVF